MTSSNLIILYLGIGCAKGLVEFVITQRAFRGHPHANMVAGPDMLAMCLVKNAVAWPVFLFWLALLGFLKVFLFFRRPGGKGRSD
jgi:hypothetical protein